MTAQIPNASREGAWSEVSILVAGLALASGVELAILRTFTRTAVHIPAMHDLQKPYGVVSATGQYVYFAAVVLVIAAIAAFAAQMFRAAVPARHLVLFGMILFTIPAAAASYERVDSLALDVGTVAAVFIVCGAIAVTEGGRSVFPIACFGFAFAAAGGYTTLPGLASVNISVEQPAWLLNASEYLGVGFAATTPLLLRGTVDMRARWAGAAVGVVVLVMFVGSGSTSRFLLLWNVGLSGILPGFVYAMAAGALATTVVAMLRHRSYLTAAGLVLLVTGGIGLHSTYQSALVVVGLVAAFNGMRLEATENHVQGFAPTPRESRAPQPNSDRLRGAHTK